jgi:ribose/xylose/arabinose/galactoside ABC-type transport system permease subunit
MVQINKNGDRTNEIDNFKKGGLLTKFSLNIEKYKSNLQYKYYLNFLKRMIPFIALIIISLFFSIVAGDRFLTKNNLLVLLQQSVVVAVAGFGLTFVIVAGSIDLSSGSIIALTGMVAASISLTQGWVIGIISGMLIGALCGFINGFNFAILKVPSFIVTLGMLSMARGLTIIYSRSMPVLILNSYEFLGARPTIFIVLGVAFVISYLLFNYTTFGRYCLAIGGDERVSELTGVDITRQKLLIFVYAGLMSGLAGVILSARLSAATPTAAVGFELNVISSVVLGGTPLTGGIGSIQGTVIGALIMSVLDNGLVILGVSTNVQMVIRGVILILAVFISFERAKIGHIK